MTENSGPHLGLNKKQICFPNAESMDLKIIKIQSPHYFSKEMTFNDTETFGIVVL